jgi:hypothetical protein
VRDYIKLKLGGEAMIPYLMRLFNTSINNSRVPDDWKSAIVVPIYKAGDKGDVNNYRPVSLTSVVCKIIEHLVGQYIRNVLETKGWFYKGQHGFREGFSYESQIISLCQDLSEVVDKGGGLML